MIFPSLIRSQTRTTLNSHCWQKIVRKESVHMRFINFYQRLQLSRGDSQSHTVYSGQTVNFKAEVHGAESGLFSPPPSKKPWQVKLNFPISVKWNTHAVGVILLAGGVKETPLLLRGLRTAKAENIRGAHGRQKLDLVLPFSCGIPGFFALLISRYFKKRTVFSDCKWSATGWTRIHQIFF